MTALHYHFPWMIKVNLRWSIFWRRHRPGDAAPHGLGAVLAYEYFSSPVMRDAIHQKVASLFPPHETTAGRAPLSARQARRNDFLERLGRASQH